MTQKFTSLRAIIPTLYRKDIFRQVGKSWNGFGLTYLMVLLAICLMPVSMKRTVELSETLFDRSDGLFASKQDLRISDSILNIIHQVPPMTVNQGTLSVQGEQPRHIVMPETGTPLVLIDTTGKTSAADASQALLLVTKTSIILRDAGGQNRHWLISDLTRKFNISHNQTLHLNEDVLLQWLETTKERFKMAPLLFFFNDFLYLFLAFAMRAFIFGGVGLVICVWLKTELTYTTTVRLAAVAATPVILLESLSLFLGKPLLLYENLIYMLLHSVYLFRAIEANGGTKEKG